MGPKEVGRREGAGGDLALWDRGTGGGGGEGWAGKTRVRGTRHEGRGRAGGGAGPRAGDLRAEGSDPGKVVIAHACSRKGGSPGSYKAPGINMKWGRVGGAGSAAALRKGPRVGLRSLAAKLRRTRRRGLQERWGKEPGVEMGARPESAAENRDGFRGVGCSEELG